MNFKNLKKKTFETYGASNGCNERLLVKSWDEKSGCLVQGDCRAQKSEGGNNGVVHDY